MKTLFILIAVCSCAVVASAAMSQDAPAGGSSGERAADQKSSAKPPPFGRSGLPPEYRAAHEAANAPIDEAERHARALLSAGDLVGAERECLAALEYARTTPMASPGFVRALLADIYLREGRNREALNTYLSVYPNFGSASMALNICIALCRLGDFRIALPYYTDAVARGRFMECDLVGQAPRPQDGPGTSSPAALQASALLARGIWKQGSAQREDALRDFQAAERLAPGNPLIAYHAATMLDELKRYKEALPYYRRAAYCGNRFVAEQAKRKIASLQAWLAQPHPKTKEPEGE